MGGESEVDTAMWIGSVWEGSVITRFVVVRDEIREASARDLAGPACGLLGIESRDSGDGSALREADKPALARQNWILVWNVLRSEDV